MKVRPASPDPLAGIVSNEFAYPVPGDSSPQLRIVVGVATVGRRDEVRSMLDVLARQTRLPDRVIICPGSSADFDETYRLPRGPNVEVVQGPRGLCAQRNMILRACTSDDVIVFFDDDFYPAPDYLQQVAALFTIRPDIVIATNIPLLDGAQGPGVGHSQALDAIANVRPLSSAAARVSWTYGGYGCNMALRLAPILSNQLLFDEQLPLYGWLEDIDFSRRLAEFGQVVRAPRLRGVHLGTKSGRTSGLRLGYSQVANPIYMIRKGSVTPSYALRHVAKNMAMNVLRAPVPEPWVDRLGRLRGNLHGLVDLVLGRLHPQRALVLQ